MAKEEREKEEGRKKGVKQISPREGGEKHLARRYFSGEGVITVRTA